MAPREYHSRFGHIQYLQLLSLTLMAAGEPGRDRRVAETLRGLRQQRRRPRESNQV